VHQPGDELGGAGPADGEHGDVVGDRDEADLPRVHHAPAASAAAADGPEHVVGHGGTGERVAARVDEDGVQDVVGGEPELPRQQAEAAAGGVPAHADRRAGAGGEGEGPVRQPHRVVDLAQRRAGLDPGRGGDRVDVDVVQVGEVDHHEGDVVLRRVGEALVAVPAAAHADRQRGAARAEDGVLDVALGGRENDGGRLADAWEREAEVPDGGVEERRVAWG